MERHVCAAIVLGLAALGAPPSGPARVPSAAERAIEQVSIDELRAHVSVLAGDAMMGRGVGHAGNRDAETYAADALRRSNVAPADGRSYFQAVEVYEPVLGSDARLTAWSADGGTLADLATGRDFYPLPDSGDVPVSGPVVCASYGVSAPEWRHDDYAKIDARGAIVLVQDDAPASLTGRVTLGDEQRRHVRTLDRKMADARAHGAVGLLVISSALDDVRTVWPERTSVQSASYRLYARIRRAPLAVAAISADAAGKLRRAIAPDRPVRAELTPAVVARRTTIHNVLGAIEGREGLEAGVVVLGAHLDHDGIDTAGQIYNGADDNASGTAAVLALGAAFARAATAGERPQRTVVFALWNGEEKGLLGSEHYVDAPVPARPLATVNLDMIGRNQAEDGPEGRRGAASPAVRSDTANIVHLVGYSYSPEFAKVVARANEAVRLTVKEEYDRGARALLRRSDQWPFLQRGVPAILLTTGLHPDYHTPADDADRIDFGKLERVAELAGRVVWMAADGPAPRLKTK